MRNRLTPRLFRTQQARRQARSHLCDLLTVWGSTVPLVVVRGLESKLRIHPGTLTAVASKLRLLRDEVSAQSSLPPFPQRPFAKVRGLGVWHTGRE